MQLDPILKLPSHPLSSGGERILSRASSLRQPHSEKSWHCLQAGVKAMVTSRLPSQLDFKNTAVLVVSFEAGTTDNPGSHPAQSPTPRSQAHLKHLQAPLEPDRRKRIPGERGNDVKGEMSKGRPGFALRFRVCLCTAPMKTLSAPAEKTWVPWFFLSGHPRFRLRGGGVISLEGAKLSAPGLWLEN